MAWRLVTHHVLAAKHIEEGLLHGETRLHAGFELFSHHALILFDHPRAVKGLRLPELVTLGNGGKGRCPEFERHHADLPYIQQCER